MIATNSFISTIPMILLTLDIVLLHTISNQPSQLIQADTPAPLLHDFKQGRCFCTTGVLLLNKHLCSPVVK